MRAGFISWTTDGLTISFYFILMGTLIVISTRFLKFFKYVRIKLLIESSTDTVKFKNRKSPTYEATEKFYLIFQNQLFKPAVDEFLIRRTKKN